MEKEFIKIRMSNIENYLNTPLFLKSENDNYVLYKATESNLNKNHLEEGTLPKELYIHSSDKLKSLVELQKTFNAKLKKDIQYGIKSGDVTEVKNTLVNIMKETLSEPRAGSLKQINETMDIMVVNFSENTNLLQTMANMQFKDYTTIIHSINVMALTLGYCFHSGNYSSNDIKELVMSKSRLNL